MEQHREHRKVRERLTLGAAGPAEAAHLEGCPECATFARRLELARQAFRPAEAGAEPDPGFARRVVERLPGPSEVLGWAALRALPAALALALTLFWLGLSQPQPATHLLAADADPELLLTWAALSPAEGAP